MRNRLKFLDLFCCQGGAAKGYHRAGFDQIDGVDIDPQPRYPFNFIQGDALLYLFEHGHEYDAIHASPPCKLNTSLKAFSSDKHVELIPQTRQLLSELDVPWVIENVPGADMKDPVTLCGSMFGLHVRRHRLFETNWKLPQPECRHDEQAANSPGYQIKRYHSGKPVIQKSPVVGIYGRGQGLGPGETDLWREVMEMPWASKAGLNQAIPPAYTEFIGKHLLKEITL